MLKVVAAAALCATASGFVAPVSVRASSTVAIRMDEAAPKKAAPKKEKPPPKPKVPGEGDPFGEIAQAYGNANRDGGSAFQPRGISDATVVDAYQAVIENDDEPWHSTCRPVTVLDIPGLAKAKPANVLEAEAAEEASGKKKIGGDKPGWSDKRVVASTHDNSV